MQYQIRDPQGFAAMLDRIIEQNELPPLPFCESEEKRMKRNYIIAAFRETVAQQFPEQSVELNRLLDEKLSRLRSMHLNASKGKQFHLESQILPGIAAYETLQTVMPKDEALQTVHGYVAEHAWTMRKPSSSCSRCRGSIICRRCCSVS